ncbi:hypothetical protein GLYMA_20G111850v4 [Glycine max]|nr:hypothetical protein GLYMA_20G111850v4 [Glycine max]
MIATGGSSFQVKYSRLYFNSVQKHASIGDMGCWENDIWVRELRWRRGWFDWEIPPLNSCLPELEGIVLNRQVEDTLSWKNASTGLYGVQEVYKVLLPMPGHVDSFFFDQL